jgi:arylsulfatase A-like enzyme
MDSDIGRLLETLKKQGIDKNTIIVFTSDNGAEFNSPFFENNKPFKGKKRDVYEGGVHVPFVVRWTDKVKAGSTTDHISAFWDFLPTACEIAGVKPSIDIDGISYLPTLLGNIKKQKQHEYLYWEFNEGTPKQGIRMGNWKFVKLWNKPPELYDLSKDIAETTNLAEQHPDLVEKFTKLLQTARTNDPNYDLVPVKQGKAE